MKKWTLTVLVGILICISTCYAEETLTEEFIKGKTSGETAAEEYYNPIGWGVSGGIVGFLCGVAAGQLQGEWWSPLVCGGLFMGYTAIYPPESPPLTYMKEKSSEYKKGFMQGYKDKARSKNLIASNVGLGIGAGAGVLLVLMWMNIGM